jgi:hypothetical protein
MAQKMSISNITSTKIDDTITAVNQRLEVLFQDLDPAKVAEDHALMLISWELGMRISSTINELDD